MLSWRVLLSAKCSQLLCVLFIERECKVPVSRNTELRTRNSEHKLEMQVLVCWCVGESGEQQVEKFSKPQTMLNGHLVNGKAAHMNPYS